MKETFFGHGKVGPIGQITMRTHIPKQRNRRSSSVSHAREPPHQELEQNEVRRTVCFGEGKLRGNEFSICVQGPGTICQQGRVQRRQCTIGCFTTPRPGETQTRGLQFLVFSELERE